MMTMFASGNTERAGRAGWTFGNLVKRLVWPLGALTGLIVAVLVIQRGTTYRIPNMLWLCHPGIVNPGDHWFNDCRHPAANMSSCSNFMVNLGSLFTRDIYQPYLRPEVDDKGRSCVGNEFPVCYSPSSEFFCSIIKMCCLLFLFVETMAAFVALPYLAECFREKEPTAWLLLSFAFVLYYALNFSATGTLQLIYKWQPEPFHGQCPLDL